MERTIAGATQDPVLWGDDGDLPVVVWLTGDEPHFSEFSMDAAAVMAALGIKRSRLTQISGRELRVGRVRRGRHVVPVFRPEDVEAYKAWTRAPATHMKSSDALTAATGALTSSLDQIVTTVAAMNTDLAVLVRDQVRQAVSAQLAPLLALIGRQEEELGRGQRTIERLIHTVTALSGRLDQTHAASLAQHSLARAEAAVGREATEARLRALFEAEARLQDGNAGLTARVEELGEALAAKMAMLAEVQERQGRNLADGFAALSATKPAPRRHQAAIKALRRQARVMPVPARAPAGADTAGSLRVRRRRFKA